MVTNNTISYSYDAAGNKVQERSTINGVNGVTKITDYIGNFVYEDHVAKYAMTSEGRTTFDITTAQPIKEEFFVKDHLSNVRSVVDVYNWPIAQYLATYELASANLEGLFFGDMEDVRDIKPGSTDPNDNRAGNLNGADPDRRIGTSMLLKVMAGDKVELKVNNYYDGYNADDDQPVYMEDMLGSVISTLTGGEGGFTGSEAHDTKLVTDVFGMPNYQAFDEMVNEGTDAQKPKAYLNYLLFNERMELVPEMSGAFQANGNGSWTQIGTTAPMVVPANGYLAVYLSNRTVLSCGSCGDVFFDQLMVRMTSGKLKEEAHYYPYGLPISTMGSVAAGFIPNKNKYQSNEYNKEQGLNWMDFHNRQYDPQIGRFLSIDPLAANTVNLSPYTAMNDDPANFTDPLGLQANFLQMQQSHTNVSPVMSTGRPKYNGPGPDREAALGDFNAACAQAAFERQNINAWASMLGQLGSVQQGTTVTFNNGVASGNQFGNVMQEIVITASKGQGKNDGPGFFGRIWGSFMGAVNWLDQKLSPGSDVHERNDKTYDKDGGGIMFTGGDGQNEEGRKVGSPDKQSVDVDAMMFMFGHGGSGGLGNWSDGFESFNNLMSSFMGVHDATSQLNDVMKPYLTDKDTLINLQNKEGTSLISIPKDSLMYFRQAVYGNNGYYNSDNIVERK